MDNHGLPSIEDQYEQCRRWRDWFRDAGYQVWINYTDDPYFDREWLVYQDDDEGNAAQVATFDADGCGASWHGPDELWLAVIGPHEGVTK